MSLKSSSLLIGLMTLLIFVAYLICIGIRGFR